MKHIVLTGGGTAGHVTPNIALIPRLKELGYEISYIGSYDGIEKKLILHSKKARPAFRSGRAENQGCKKPFPKISLELATMRKAWGSIFFR